MKSKLYLFLILVVYSFKVYSQENNLQTVLNVANSGFENYLNKIPVGQESYFGFNNREEFKIAKVGKPYEVMMLSADFYKDSMLEANNYIVASGQWKVAITVNGESRVMVTVAKMNGAWEVVGIGAAGLSKELETMSKMYSPKAAYGTILSVMPLESEFFITNSKTTFENFKAYPLASADLSFGKQERKYSYFELKELLSLMKSKINNK